MILTRLPLRRRVWQVPLLAIALVAAAMASVHYGHTTLGIVLAAFGMPFAVRAYFVLRLFNEKRVLITRHSEIRRSLPNRARYFHHVFQHSASGMIVYISYHGKYTYIWCVDWEDFEDWRASAPTDRIHRDWIPCVVYRLNKHTSHIVRRKANVLVGTTGNGAYDLDTSQLTNGGWTTDNAEDFGNPRVFAAYGDKSLRLVERLGGLAARGNHGSIGGVKEFVPRPPFTE